MTLENTPAQPLDLEALENYRSTMWYARTFIEPSAIGKPVIEALEKHCQEIDMALRAQPEDQGVGVVTAEYHQECVNLLSDRIAADAKEITDLKAKLRALESPPSKGRECWVEFTPAGHPINVYESEDSARTYRNPAGIYSRMVEAPSKGDGEPSATLRGPSGQYRAVNYMAAPVSPRTPAPRPMKLKVEIAEGRGRHDLLHVESYPIGGFVQAGPKDLVREIADRLLAFEARPMEEGKAPTSEPPCLLCGQKMAGAGYSWSCANPLCGMFKRAATVTQAHVTSTLPNGEEGKGEPSEAEGRSAQGEPGRTVAAVLAWQADGRIHPLTCKDSNHGALLPYVELDGGVHLMCRTCTYRQAWIPEVVLEKYANEAESSPPLPCGEGSDPKSPAPSEDLEAAFSEWYESLPADDDLFRDNYFRADKDTLRKAVRFGWMATRPPPPVQGVEAQAPGGGA
jgi:hypothetical protein